jgi:allantoinase
MSRLPYSPARGRPPISWPNGARVAVWFVVNTEHYEFVPPSQYRVWPRVAAPDVQQYAFRDFGNRVGFWRLLDVLDEYPIPVTTSLNLGVLDLFPEIASAMHERRWDYMSHGYYNTRPVHSVSIDQERADIRDACAALQRHSGESLKGMLSPMVSCSPHTFDLMAEAGMIYTADAFHDDQPAPVLTKHGKLVSIPYTVDLNDGNLYVAGSMNAFAARAQAQFDRLWREGEHSGTVMCIALHPYLVGQPHLISHVRALLDGIVERDAVWWTTGAEIAKYYLKHHYDAQLAHALETARD